MNETIPMCGIYNCGNGGFKVAFDLADFDECEHSADHICDNDINQLADCSNTIGSYSCICPYKENGVYWDGLKCTTGIEMYL